jgi:hypothetical protein
MSITLVKEKIKLIWNHMPSSIPNAKNFIGSVFLLKFYSCSLWSFLFLFFEIFPLFFSKRFTFYSPSFEDIIYLYSFSSLLVPDTFLIYFNYLAYFDYFLYLLGFNYFFLLFFYSSSCFNLSFTSSKFITSSFYYFIGSN